MLSNGLQAQLRVFWHCRLEYHDLMSLFEFLDNGDGEITLQLGSDTDAVGPCHGTSIKTSGYPSIPLSLCPFLCSVMFLLRRSLSLSWSPHYLFIELPMYLSSLSISSLFIFVCIMYSPVSLPIYRFMFRCRLIASVCLYVCLHPSMPSRMHACIHACDRAGM